MADNIIQVPSNVKYITSGVVPTTEKLKPGELAFGTILEDGNVHLYSNPGAPDNPAGIIKELPDVPKLIASEERPTSPTNNFIWLKLETI